jgi:hypothetical protein
LQDSFEGKKINNRIEYFLDSKIDLLLELLGFAEIKESIEN